MAETRKTVRALIFESTIAKNAGLMKSEMKIEGKIIPRELKFVETVTRNRRDSDGEVENKFTKVSNLRRYHFMTSSERPKQPSARMLVYEDSSDEEEGGDDLRTTPPNPQERRATATPRAPTKSRKEFDKKILRPKKLVYCNEKENENENYFYNLRSEGENIYKNLTEVVTMPKKIFHLPTDEELHSSLANRRIVSAANQDGEKKNRNRNTNDVTTRRNGKSKNGTTNDDKENNVAVIANEYSRDVGQASDSSKNRSSSLKYHDREEFASLSKPGEFTHFRI